MADTKGKVTSDGDIDSSQIAIGTGNRITTTYQDTLTWREFVRRDLESLEQRLLILLIAVMVLYFLGFVATLATIRQFDLIQNRLEKVEQRNEYQPYYPMPTP